MNWISRLKVKLMIHVGNKWSQPALSETSTNLFPCFIFLSCFYMLREREREIERERDRETDRQTVKADRQKETMLKRQFRPWITYMYMCMNKRITLVFTYKESSMNYVCKLKSMKEKHFLGNQISKWPHLQPS